MRSSDNCLYGIEHSTARLATLIKYIYIYIYICMYVLMYDYIPFFCFPRLLGAARARRAASFGRVWSVGDAWCRQRSDVPVRLPAHHHESKHSDVLPRDVRPQIHPVRLIPLHAQICCNSRSLNDWWVHSEPFQYCNLRFFQFHMSLLRVLPSTLGARCSSVVRVFTHGAMGCRIDPSWWTH